MHHDTKMKALTLCGLLLCATALADEPTISVLDFEANGASPQLASAIGGMVANELQRVGAFRVTTSQSTRDAIALERQSQLFGCAGEGCAEQASKLAALLGTDALVRGKVSRIAGGKQMPTTLTLELTLLDAKTGRRTASDLQTALTEAELVGKVGKSVNKLVSKLLGGLSGSLLLTVGEPGAAVKVDDSQIGTTPLEGRVALPAGPHLVEVEKKGFVTVRKDVRIVPSGLVEVQVTLVPSPDFVRDYEATQSKLRVGAWACTGLAVAGAVGYAGLQLRASALYGSPDTPNTFLYYRARLQGGIELQDGVDQRAAANGLINTIALQQTLSFAAAGVGGAAAIGAVVLWIVGDDPGRYSKFKQLSPQLTVVPTKGGADASLWLSF